MIRVFSFALAVSLLAGTALAQDPPATPADAQLTSDASYTIGHSIGQNINKQDLNLDPQKLIDGLMDGLRGTKSKFTEEQVKTIMTAFQKRQVAKQEANQNAFMAQNGKKPGVMTTPSGLQYKVLKAGSGVAPKADDTVIVHYRGTLTDGTEFDSSYKRKMPATFKVNQVIPGWTEALKLMKPGGRWQLVIPSKLAYGERGTPGGPIGPNETLVFEVELVGVK